MSGRDFRLLRRATACASVGFAAMVWSGCDPGGSGLGNLAEQCGLVCSGEGIIDGNAKISGITEIDAFFGAVIDSTAASASVRDGIRADLARLALSLDLEAGSSGEAIAEALGEHIDAHTDGGLTVSFSDTVCSASVEVAALAAAECDVDVNPESVIVNCEGSCGAESGVAVDCGVDAMLRCRGVAPNLECTETCTGDCRLEVAAACSGVCRGTCSGTCSVEDGNGNCAGQCEGTCEGTCELGAGGDCSGTCEGQCEWTPPDSTCDASLEAECTASAGATVNCGGRCRGTAEPPSISAECEATVQAKADASLECQPPRVTITWQWAAGLDANAQAEFRAWLITLEQASSSAKSKGIKGDILVDGFAALEGAGEGAVNSAANAALEGDLKAKIGAECAVVELRDVSTLLGESATELTAVLSDLALVLAVLEDGSLSAPGSLDN